MRSGKEIVLAGDLETGEEYLAEILDDLPHGHNPVPCPVVRVLRVARYPNQRAIAHPEIPLDMPSIAAGTLCRLEVIRPAAEQDMALLDITEQEAMQRAIQKALNAAPEGEREILLRHLNGVFRRKRVRITFRENDLEYLQMCSTLSTKKDENNELPESLDELSGGH